MKYKIAYSADIYGPDGHSDKRDDEEKIFHVESSQGHIRKLGTLYNNFNYSRGLPDISTSSEHFAALMSIVCPEIDAKCAECPASIAVEFSEVLIHDSVIYLPSTDGIDIFYPTHRPNDRPYVRQLDEEALSLISVKEIPVSGRRLLYLGSAGSFNYGHWLVDDLPRVKIINDDRRPTTILMQSFDGMDEVRKASVKYMTRGVDVDFMFMQRDDVVHRRNLTYVTPVSVHPYVKNTAALNYLRDQVQKRRRLRGARERLYVKRRASRGRQLLNADEIETILQEFGFRSIDPEALPFDKQVGAFAEAGTIVGIMGATMCNSIFTPRGANLLYLAPNDWTEPFYWDLATVMEHSYAVIYGERALAEEMPFFDDFSIDADLFRRKLVSLLQP